MATTRKPAARSTLKRNTAAKKTTTPSKPKPAPKVVSESEKQAMLEAYNALKLAGLPIPEELQVVDGWIRELHERQKALADQWAAEREQEEAVLTEANKNGPWYVRNCYQAPFNLRLDRQTEKRRLELKARGRPGDLHPIKDEDLKDPILRANLNLGLIEIIPAGEANKIIEKQTTNMSTRVHTPLAMLRNELQQPYKQGQVKVEAEFNSQGVTVAQVEPGLMQGQLHDRQVGGVNSSGGITRVQPGQQVHQAHQDSEQATSIIRSGFVPTGGQPASIQAGSEAHARMVDDLARRKNLQGPAAGLGDIQVVVGEVQRT